MYVCIYLSIYLPMYLCISACMHARMYVVKLHMFYIKIIGLEFVIEVVLQNMCVSTHDCSHDAALPSPCCAGGGWFAAPARANHGAGRCKPPSSTWERTRGYQSCGKNEGLIIGVILAGKCTNGRFSISMFVYRRVTI